MLQLLGITSVLFECMYSLLVFVGEGEQYTVCLQIFFISKAWKHLYNSEEHLNDISLITVSF